jgi:cholesterol oxidase
MDRTYMPLALGAGAEVRALCEVVSLQRTIHGYRVDWLDHGAGRRGHAEAALVVLAAGTFGTLRLLFSARRDHLLDLPPSLGRRFSLGGDMMGSISGFVGAGESEFGPCVGAAVFVERDGQHRFAIAEGGTPAEALPIPAALRRRLADGVGLAAMGRDASDGTVSFDGRELHTTAGRSLDPELYAEVERALSSIADGYDARQVSINLPGRLLMTVHPMGGASIADQEDVGVVDHTGQVFGNPGLHIADASTFPHAPGIPPSMTIAALAERQAELITRSTRTERLPDGVEHERTLALSSA